MNISGLIPGPELKGTVGGCNCKFKSTPIIKKGHARITTVLFKPLSDQECGRYRRFSSLKSV